MHLSGMKIVSPHKANDHTTDTCSSQHGPLNLGQSVVQKPWVTPLGHLGQAGPGVSFLRRAAPTGSTALLTSVAFHQPMPTFEGAEHRLSGVW